jgi:hypothetical protein
MTMRPCSVDQNSASWNRVAAWLRQIEGMHRTLVTKRTIFRVQRDSSVANQMLPVRSWLGNTSLSGPVDNWMPAKRSGSKLSRA